MLLIGLFRLLLLNLFLIRLLFLDFWTIWSSKVSLFVNVYPPSKARGNDPPLVTPSYKLVLFSWHPPSFPKATTLVICSSIETLWERFIAMIPEFLLVSFFYATLPCFSVLLSSVDLGFFPWGVWYMFFAFSPVLVSSSLEFQVSKSIVLSTNRYSCLMTFFWCLCCCGGRFPCFPLLCILLLSLIFISLILPIFLLLLTWLLLAYYLHY